MSEGQVIGVQLKGGHEVAVAKQGTVQNKSFTSGSAGTVDTAISAPMFFVVVNVWAYVKIEGQDAAATSSNGVLQAPGVRVPYKGAPGTTTPSAIGVTQSGVLSVEEVGE